MKSKNSKWLILVIALLSIPRSNSQELVSIQKTISNQQIEQLILDTRTKVNSILKKEVYLPGIAVAIVSRDSILLAEGFGYRDKFPMEKSWLLITSSPPTETSGYIRYANE